jgi:mannose-6-phosphate isomerase-like protein (cupin superfamily)
MISKANAERYTWGEICDGWRLVNRSELSIIHERMPANTREVRHYHQTARQFFFILSGAATLEVNGVRETLRELQGLEIAPTIPHQMMNESNQDVEFLVISHPTTQGDRVNLP